MDKTDRPAFYPLDLFPKLKLLAQSWPTMQRELSELHAPTMNINRGHRQHEEVANDILNQVISGQEYGWVLGWGENEGNKNWTQYGLILENEPVPFALEKMPQTCLLLNNIEGIHVAALARLAPDTFLPAHTHPELLTNNLLQMHITLQSAEHNNFAYLNVAGTFVQQIEGTAYIFDGSLKHFAINASDQDRVILYLEFYKNKLLCSNI